MKKFISVVGLSAALLFTAGVSAELKVAIVDVVSVLQKMPQREVVSKKLDSEFEARAKALQEEEKKADSAAQKLNKEKMTLSATEKKKLEKVITSFQEKAKEFSLDYRKRENEEASKLLDKIQVAVDAVAKEGKYDLILKAEAALYATEATDVTGKVLDQVKK